MIKNYTTAVTFLILLGILSLTNCTNKEIKLVTNIDFEGMTTIPEEGFVKDSLATTISVIPQQPYPDFYYYAKYELVQGEGYFVDAAGELIPENEDRLLSEEEGYTANWTYIGTTAEEHLVKMYYRDNYEKRKEEQLRTMIKNVDILWEASTEQTTAVVKDTIPITLTLANQTEGRAVGFEYRIQFTEGAGQLLDVNKEPIEKGKLQAIEEGGTTIQFVPLQGGANTLVFDLIDSNGQELQDTLSVEVEGETINLPPVAVDDEIEVTVGMEKIIEVLLNDTDPEEDMLKIEAIVQQPINGTASINEDGTITYIPNPSLPPGAKDVFIYTIKDDPTGNLSENEATVSITFIDRETIPIADAMFEQKLIEEGHDTDGVVNGVMYKDDAEAIVSLVITSATAVEIKNFGGIEYFVNLEDLTVSFISGEIESFDLSQNTKLTKLSFGYATVNNFVQPKFSNLREISIGFGGLIGVDFTLISSLEAVSLTNASYTEVDFSNLKNLKTIRIPAYGNLESLNLEGVSNLESLEITTSAIISLDLSDITDLATLKIAQSSNLECIQVKDVNEALTNTNWTIQLSPKAYYSLDCSQPRETVSIPDPVFEAKLRELGFDSDMTDNNRIYKTEALEITSLNLSRDLNDTSLYITQLIGIESFVNLEIFTMSFRGSSDFISFDLSQNKKVKEIRLGYFNLPTNFMFGDFPELEKVFLTQMNNNGVRVELDEDFTKNTKLKSFGFSQMSMGDLDFRNATNLEAIGIGLGGYRSMNITGLRNIKRISYNSKQTLVNTINISDIDDLEVFTAEKAEFDCVQVKNIEEAYANSNWTISDNTYYSLDCSQPRETVAIPDPVFERKLREAGFDSDGVENAMIYETDASAITELNISGVDINNSTDDPDQFVDEFTGIEEFENLKKLTIHGKHGDLNLNKNNGLEELSLSGASFLSYSNERLENLDILNINRSNVSVNLSLFPNLKQFSRSIYGGGDFDFSENTLLEEISLYALGVSLLDLSTLNNLRVLKLNSLGLSADLDLNNLANLETLEIMGANLKTNLSLKNNVNLINLTVTGQNQFTCIEVNNIEEAYANSNWIISDDKYYSADCSQPRETIPFNNPALEQALIDLKWDDVLDNKIYKDITTRITSLDVSDKNLTSLNGIELFTELEVLNASQNQLTSFGNPSLLKLKELNVSNNQITTISLSTNVPNVEVYDISNNDINYITYTSFIPVTQIRSFKAEGNPDLRCIEVSDVAEANAALASGNWSKDATANYTNGCR